MKYNIKIEPKIKKEPKNEPEYCNIIAKKDGTITRIISSKGTEIYETNDNVKKGSILISGEIKYNEELKGKTCATGKVYAKTWYTIQISLPLTYEEQIKQKKYRYNIQVRSNNKKYKLFKNRIKNYTEENTKIINLFGKEIYLQKEIEITKKEVNYTEEEINELIDNKIQEKINILLGTENKILERKVLKKEENDSKIDIVMFIVVEELISEISY